MPVPATASEMRVRLRHEEDMVDEAQQQVDENEIWNNSEVVNEMHCWLKINMFSDVAVNFGLPLLSQVFRKERKKFLTCCLSFLLRLFREMRKNRESLLFKK